MKILTDQLAHGKECGFLGAFVLWLMVWVCLVPVAAKEKYKPISLHPENPHYLLWRGKPVVLLTSGEHFGAVLNRKFDYKKYLRTLQGYGFNLTRIFSGVYCEPVGAHKIEHNTLSPLKGDLLCPWARSSQPGYANGGNKFDLTRWDSTYFARLHDFIRQAGRHGVVVELDLFCPMYKKAMWRLSPMNSRNNINGIGQVKMTDIYNMKDEKLQAVQDALVRKLVTELKDYDNLYYEICNEPYYFGDVPRAWQNHIADIITTTEKNFPYRHLIAWNIANKGKTVVQPIPAVSIFNYHYCKPPQTVYDNYHWNRAIGDDETGFNGSKPGPYRREAWDFMLAGGAIFNNLDYSFTVGHEDGSAIVKAPGSVGREMQHQVSVLKDFMQRCDFIHMKPDNSVITGGIPKKATARALVKTGSQYAIYINGGQQANLQINLPKGYYQAEWLDTKTGKWLTSKRFQHKGGVRVLSSPAYFEDIALLVWAVQ